MSSGAPPRATWRGLVRLLAVLLALAVRAQAHPLSVSYSRFETTRETLDVTVRLPLDDVDLLLQLDADLDGKVGGPEIEAAREKVAGYVLRHVAAAHEGGPVALAAAGVGPWADQQGQPYVEARLRGPAPGAKRLVLRVTALSDLYSSHRNLSEVVSGPVRQQFVFQGGNAWTVDLAAQGRLAAAREFLVLGVEHIATGYDHVLFLVGVLLVGETLRQVVAIVTSFTVAHSVTLALATLGLVAPPPRLVEAVIALSIVYVGVENILARRVRRRWLLTFGFGLVHGFGFAGILREMDLARSGVLLGLVTFNLGVEVGQVAIVGVLWPALRAVQQSRHRVAVVRYASAAIAACGLVWLVERLA